MTWSYRAAHDEHRTPGLFFLIEDGTERASVCVLGDDPERLMLRIINGLDGAPPMPGFGGSSGDMLLERRRQKIRNEEGGR